MLLAWRSFLPMILLGVFFAYSFFEFTEFFALAPLFTLHNQKFSKKEIYISFFFLFFFFIFKNNIANCGVSVSDPIGDIQSTATQIVLNEMTEAELDEFLRAIHFRPANGWEVVDYYHQYGTQAQPRFNVQAFFLWLAGSTLLFIFSLWGDVILDFLFSLPSTAVSIVPDIYHGLTATMIAIGREAILDKK